ncbi:MAG: hypothetical protein Kow0069_10600 [Promethearchaeota archaeon]
MSRLSFRYLIPESIFNDLLKDVVELAPHIVQGWIYADRKENFALVTGYSILQGKSKHTEHVQPKSWMRLKKNKIYSMRKLKAEKNVDIVWSFHSHPDGEEALHEIDLKILNYLSTGVMIIVTPTNVVGWYFDKRETKKPLIEKMVFEIISD